MQLQGWHTASVHMALAALAGLHTIRKQHVLEHHTLSTFLLCLPAVIAAHLNSRALNAFVFVWCPGYIAVEMAGILNALGTDTTLFCRGARSHVHSQKLAFLQKRGWSFVL